MFNIPSGIIKEVKSSKHLHRINSIENQVNINNLIDKLDSNNIINNNNNSDLYFKKKQENIENKKYKNKKANTPKTLFISSKKNLISINKNRKNTNQYYDNAIKSNNMFIKDCKNKKIEKSYISPTFDYNIKNNHKTSIRLNLKNNNSNPIKLKKEDFTNINTNKNIKYISNSSINGKSSSTYLTNSNSNREKTLKNNNINSKRTKRNNMKKNFYDVKTANRKYISYTPDCIRNSAFIKNKHKKLYKKKEQKKETVRMIFEKEFKDRMIFGLKTKENRNHNSLSISYSRNRFENFKDSNYSNNQSQKNIFKYENKKNKIKDNKNKEIHKYNTINVDKNYNNKKNNYKQYYFLLKKKIKNLNEEIEKIKEEEKYLILQLINYKEKENECNYIRNLREEIKKYKTIIEKTNKVCEEYSLEISKIKNII